MDNYNKVKDNITNNGCTLLTTFEEFEEKRKTALNNYYGFVRINFNGICGHESSAVYTNFSVRKTGITCKNCVTLNTSNTLYTNNRKVNNSVTENDSIKIIEKYLTDYDIVRTNEGCTADLIIREKNTNNNCIPVQLKSTAKICHNMYSFRGMKSSYANMLLICICISDTPGQTGVCSECIPINRDGSKHLFCPPLVSEEKIWIMPYNDIHVNGNLNISKRSKYNAYFIDDNKKTGTVIPNYETKIVRNTDETFMKPVTILQQREQEYVKKRETTLEFLKFDKMEVQNTPTDFIINGKRVQEKVAGLYKQKNRLLAVFASNNGKVDGIRKHRTYRLKENDFYWINSSMDNRFWVIPEIELFNREYISKSEETNNRTTIMIPITDVLQSNNKWLKEFEYSYEKPDKNKLMKLFE